MIFSAVREDLVKSEDCDTRSLCVKRPALFEKNTYSIR